MLQKRSLIERARDIHQVHAEVEVPPAYFSFIIGTKGAEMRYAHLGMGTSPAIYVLTSLAADGMSVYSGISRPTMVLRYVFGSSLHAC
eukprot:COSAG01_NODE_7876_length_3012_cov_22.085479_3_plen_88_part_00